MLNYNCKDGKWVEVGATFDNAIDADTGSHAGYGTIAPGSDSSLQSLLVATDAANKTSTGSLTLTGSTLIFQPSKDPAHNAPMLRAAAANQQGVFSAPVKVLYATRTNTTGGVPPAAPCMQAGVLAAVPFSAEYSFYACF